MLLGEKCFGIIAAKEMTYQEEIGISILCFRKNTTIKHKQANYILMYNIKPQEYKNVLEYIKLTSNDITEQIKNQSLSFSSIKDEFVEWQLKLPIFARPFYVYVYLKNRIPTQEEFFSFYIRQNTEYFNANGFSDDIMEAIKARTFRAMPSLVRDLHFNKYVSENISGYNTLYSIGLDIENDIDLLLYNNENIYGVNLYTNTIIALQGRSAKEQRHKLFDNVKYIELPLDFNTCNKAGDYFLYGENEYNELLKIIES